MKFYDNNSTGGAGGAINCIFHVFEITKSIFEGNTAKTQVSSVGLYGGMGGGLYLQPSDHFDSNFSVRSSVFSKNIVGEYGVGGAVYLRNQPGPFFRCYKLYFRRKRGR